MSEEITRIEPRSGTSFVLREGQLLEVIDLEGGQVSDFLSFNLRDTREVISNGRTFDYEETIRLTTGNTFWSNRSNPMLDIVTDDVGVHDFLLTPCSKDTFRHFYPDKPLHRGCFGNLAAALAKYDVTEDDLPCAFNVFMNVPVNGQTGRLSVDPPTSKAGDKLILKARMDLVIGLTACSAFASNGGTFKPIGYRIS